MYTPGFESIRDFIKMPKASTIVFRKLIVAIPIVLLLLVSIVQSVQLVNAQNCTMSSDLSQKIINNTVLTYTDPVYKYKIKYPFYCGIGEPISLKKLNPNLRGELFTLNANAVRSPDVSNSVHVIITPFQKNETQQMKNALLILDSSGLRTFDINGIISNINSHLSLLKSFLINFALLNKSEIIFKNHPAYAIEYRSFNPAYKSSMQEKVIYVIPDDYLFIFEYTAKPSNYYTYLPIFQKVINSFEFENAVNDPRR